MLWGSYIVSSGSTDWSALVTTGGIGGVVVGFGMFFARGSGLQYRALKQTIVDLRLDVKTAREERDAERKLRIATETNLQLAEKDFRGFLQKKGINPDEFQLVSETKVQEIITSIDEP